MSVQAQQLPWDVELTNLQELMDDLDIPGKSTPISASEDFYNKMLATGWTLGSTQLMRVLQAVIGAYHRPTVRLLEKHWKQSQPDMVVSFVPHFNRALCESYDHVCSGRPFVTVITDIADFPPHFWIERQSQYLICGSDRAVAQARAMGHREDRIFQTSGMILHPRFYEAPVEDRTAEQLRLGLVASRRLRSHRARSVWWARFLNVNSGYRRASGSLSGLAMQLIPRVRRKTKKLCRQSAR